MTYNQTPTNPNNLHNTKKDSIIRIATSNLRGLNNDFKREMWFKTWDKERWDIIISTETNSKIETHKFWHTETHTCL